MWEEIKQDFYNQPDWYKEEIERDYRESGVSMDFWWYYKIYYYGKDEAGEVHKEA